MSGLLMATDFWWVVAGAWFAGLVRGFSGFGAAMVFVPIASAAYGPSAAVALLCIIDSVLTLPLAIEGLRRCVWREVVWLLGGYATTAPVGVLFLVMVDPMSVRWVISALILVSVGGLASGWRYQGRPSVGLTFGCGGLAGVTGGMAGLSGPPIILFWLGGQAASMTVRANIFAFFGLNTLISATLYWWHGLFTLGLLKASLLLMPAYGLGIWLGARGFRGASDALYRHAALTLCTLVALATLPIWQRIASD